MKVAGTALQLWSARNEQGFHHRQFGDSDRLLLDFEGLALVTKIKPPGKPKRGPSKPPLTTPPATCKEGNAVDKVGEVSN
jgi:hypothetical protein